MLYGLGRYTSALRDLHIHKPSGRGAFTYQKYPLSLLFLHFGLSFGFWQNEEISIGSPTTPLLQWHFRQFSNHFLVKIFLVSDKNLLTATLFFSPHFWFENLLFGMGWISCNGLLPHIPYLMEILLTPPNHLEQSHLGDEHQERGRGLLLSDRLGLLGLRRGPRGRGAHCILSTDPFIANYLKVTCRWASRTASCLTYLPTAKQSDILVLKHESRKIRYFWVVRKFKVLVFRSGRFGLLPAPAWQDRLENERLDFSTSLQYVNFVLSCFRARMSVWPATSHSYLRPASAKYK